MSDSTPSITQVAVQAGPHLIAETPVEMLTAQQSVIAWCEDKVIAQRQDAEELRVAYEHAREHKWKSDTLKRHHQIALKRVDFYVKIKAALVAGYYIVPNFPVTLFAIRSERAAPLRYYAVDKTWANPYKEQDAQLLPIGEGDYHNPFPVVQRELEKAGEGEIVKSYAAAWKELEFPITMARPKVLQAVDRAMALKIFDDIGVLPGNSGPTQTTPARKEDPIVVGRIIFPKFGKVFEKSVTFMIAWHLDLRTL